VDLAQKVEAARQQFARSLVGLWCTAQGTFNIVMAQHWVFRPDGTGSFTDTGPFGYPRSETEFEWRQAGDCLIELRLTAYTAFGEDYAADLDEDERDWQTIRYTFVPVETDFGTRVGLIDVAQVGKERGGFLNSLAPLEYNGPMNPGG
jgi:hypothetical protein